MLILIDREVSIWPTPPNWNEQAAIYCRALSGIPSDLLLDAFEHCQRRCKFLPRPAEILEPIADRLAQRRRVADLEAQRKRALAPPEPPPPPTQAELDRVAAIMREIRTTLAQGEEQASEGLRAISTATNHALREAAQRFQAGHDVDNNHNENP